MFIKSIHDEDFDPNQIIYNWGYWFPVANAIFLIINLYVIDFFMFRLMEIKWAYASVEWMNQNVSIVNYLGENAVGNPLEIKFIFSYLLVAWGCFYIASIVFFYLENFFYIYYLFLKNNIMIATISLFTDPLVIVGFFRIYNLTGESLQNFWKLDMQNRATVLIDGQFRIALMFFPVILLLLMISRFFYWFRERFQSDHKS